MFRSALYLATSTVPSTSTSGSGSAHKVVRTAKRSNSDGASAGAAVSPSPSVSPSVSVQLPEEGVLARVLQAVLAARAPSHCLSSSPPPIPGLAHVESPLLSLARAGLGLLSQGLSSVGLPGLSGWGFGSSSSSSSTAGSGAGSASSSVAAAVASAPHPAAHRDLVLFVLGGVSALEVAQLQTQLTRALSSSRSQQQGQPQQEQEEVLLRVFVGSTSLVGPDDVFYQTFVHMRHPQE